MRAPSMWTRQIKHSIEPRPCSKCDWHMLITRIEPDPPGHRLLTLECSKCGHEAYVRAAS